VKKILTFMVVTALSTGTLAVAAGGTTTFSEISEHYEAIRQALMKDATDGVADHARAIRDAAAALREDFTAERAGVSADNAETARALLPDVEKLAGNLAAANGLTDVRAAFAELTKPLVRWQALVIGKRPIVVYCPMEKKSWLQPDEPIGNPYATAMPRCGEIVAR
jgi:hypothetical protein